MKYQDILKSMPAGLDKAVLRVLTVHVGRANAIGRNVLTTQVAMYGSKTDERQVREQIKQLRRAGHLICSAAGEDGGYYMASSKQEFEEFDHSEFEAKIKDMAETRSAMRKAAERQFGTQGALF